MIHLIIEVLSHVSMFLIFLTVFYVTYVGFTQSRSMVDEMGILFDQSLNTAGLVLPPTILKGLSSILVDSPEIMKPILDDMVNAEDNTNKGVLSPLYLGVIIASVSGLIISFSLAYAYGYSMLQLLAENLISLVFIAVTDIIITTLYGNFRTLDTQYLLGLFGQKASGVNVDCDIVKDTLDKMFPIPFVQKIIAAVL
jgi:hypothetical protein